MPPGSTAVPGKPEQGPFVNLDAQALPGAGAFTDQAYSAIPPEARRLSAVVSYAKGSGATTGQVALFLQWRLDAEGGNLDAVYETVLDGATFTVTGPSAAVPEYAFQVNGPPTTTSIAFRALSVEVPVKAIGARLVAAEIGDAANPGTITARLYTSNQV
jgi:hypothetical protein